MAIIGKIRQRSGLIVTFVGLGLLLFIIPVDKIWQLFSGDNYSGIGVFNNDEVVRQEWKYENRLAIAQDNLRRNKLNSGEEGILNDAEMDQILQNVWSQMISDTIHLIELKKLGLSISDKELNNGLLNSEYPVNSSLKDLFITDGVYYKDSFAIWKSENIVPLLETSKGKQMLKYQIEDPLKNERSRYKYLSMMKYGVLGSYHDAKRLYSEKNTNATIKYIFKSYDDMDDSTAIVSDKDIKVYFNKHKYKRSWEQENEVRSYDYVVFNIDPSENDNKNYHSSLLSIKEEFVNAQNDSMFVVNNSETPPVIESPYGMQNTGMYSDQPYKGGNFSADIDKQIDSAKKGDVIGPFEMPNQNKVQLVKIYDSGEQEEASVRHILIKSPGDESILDKEKKKLADSIMYAVKRDTSKFTQLVTKYSDDPGSSASGGIYRSFPKDQMVPEFNDFSFDKPIGSIGVVKTQFGYHIIEVLEREIGTYKKLAIIDQTIRVSKETQDIFYDSIALKFYHEAKSNSFQAAAEKFGMEIKKSGYLPLTYPNKQTQGAYGPAELRRNLNISKWAFNNAAKSIMEPEYISDNELVIAHLNEVIHENDVTFNNIKSLMEPMALNKNKTIAFIKKTNVASSLEDFSKIIGSDILEIEVTYSYNNLENNNQKVAEPKLMAYIFNTEKGKISPVIEGNEGVYIIEVVDKTEAVIPEDISEEINETTANLRNIVDQLYFYSLYKAYGVKDYRIKRNILQDN